MDFTILDKEIYLAPGKCCTAIYKIVDSNQSAIKTHPTIRSCVNTSQYVPCLYAPIDILENENIVYAIQELLRETLVKLAKDDTEPLHVHLPNISNSNKYFIVKKTIKSLMPEAKIFFTHGNYFNALSQLLRTHFRVISGAVDYDLAKSALFDLVRRNKIMNTLCCDYPAAGGGAAFIRVNQLNSDELKFSPKLSPDFDLRAWLSMCLVQASEIQSLWLSSCFRQKEKQKLIQSLRSCFRDWQPKPKFKSLDTGFGSLGAAMMPATMLIAIEAANQKIKPQLVYLANQQLLLIKPKEK